MVQYMNKLTLNILHQLLINSFIQSVQDIGQSIFNQPNKITLKLILIILAFYCIQINYTHTMDKPDKDELRQVYKSSIRASYFNHMGDNKFTQKSRLQVQQIGDDEQVDQNTFRINRGFNSTQSAFLVYKKTGRVCLENGGGFFSCFGRKEFSTSLENSKLSIYQGEKIKYYFDFNVVSASIKDKKDSFQIKIKDCEKVFTFYPVQSSSSQWVAIIKESIQHSDGIKHPNDYIVNSVPEFYRKRYVSHHQFEQQANTGDILFFRSQHGAARVQQMFLNSEYDHVAVILRNKKNQLYMYESSSLEGVGLTPWKHMIKYNWYKSTQKIAWRRLNIKLTERHVNVIQTFIAKTLGKGFDITFDKIFSFQSKLQRSKQQDQSKTYFCSQLVARMYKQMGLLDQNVSCTQYYPVTFSDAGSIKLKEPGAKLQRQCIIAFD